MENPTLAVAKELSLGSNPGLASGPPTRGRCPTSRPRECRGSKIGPGYPSGTRPTESSLVGFGGLDGNPIKGLIDVLSVG